MYKVGNEVLVKAKIAEFDLDRMMYLCELLEGDCFIRFYCPKGFIADKTYESGLNDAWELAKKIVMGIDDGGIGSKDIMDMFGRNTYYTLKDFTVEEALAKIEAYEKEKEIKVGDVVYDTSVIVAEDEREYAVVTNIYATHYEVLMKCGDTSSINKGECKKTGKHIDIDSLLRQIGE